MSKPEWKVSKFNRRAVAHKWEVSPLNTAYARSLCGQVESVVNLEEPLGHALYWCKICEKSKVGK